MCGALAGFAMGSKYTGLTVFPILLLAFLVERSSGTFSTRLRNGVAFSSVALIVAAPWYLKNLLWAGNPVYPFIIGGPDWSAERLAILLAYLRSFGVDKSLADTLLLPLQPHAGEDDNEQNRSHDEQPGPNCICWPDHLDIWGKCCDYRKQGEQDRMNSYRDQSQAARTDDACVPGTGHSHVNLISDTLEVVKIGCKQACW